MNLCLLADDFERLEETCNYLEQYGSLTTYENLNQPCNSVKLVLARVIRCEPTKDNSKLVMLINEVTRNGVGNDEFRLVISGPLVKIIADQKVKSGDVITFVNPFPFRSYEYRCLSISSHVNLIFIFRKLKNLHRVDEEIPRDVPSPEEASIPLNEPGPSRAVSKPVRKQPVVLLHPLGANHIKPASIPIVPVSGDPETVAVPGSSSMTRRVEPKLRSTTALVEQAVVTSDSDKSSEESFVTVRDTFSSPEKQRKRTKPFRGVRRSPRIKTFLEKVTPRRNLPRRSQQLKEIIEISSSSDSESPVSPSDCRSLRVRDSKNESPLRNRPSIVKQPSGRVTKRTRDNASASGPSNAARSLAHRSRHASNEQVEHCSSCSSSSSEDHPSSIRSISAPRSPAECDKGVSSSEGSVTLLSDSSPPIHDSSKRRICRTRNFQIAPNSPLDPPQPNFKKFVRSYRKPVIEDPRSASSSSGLPRSSELTSRFSWLSRSTFNRSTEKVKRKALLRQGKNSYFTNLSSDSDGSDGISEERWPSPRKAKKRPKV